MTQKVFCFYLALRELHEDKLCDTLQAMVSINVKMVHQTSLLFIEGNLDRLGLDCHRLRWLPTASVPSNKADQSRLLDRHGVSYYNRSFSKFGSNLSYSTVSGVWLSIMLAEQGINSKLNTLSFFHVPERQDRS